MSAPKQPAESLDAKMERMRTEPYLYIATEIHHGSGEHIAIHEIQLPPFLSPKSYQPGLSMEAFRNGKRKGASKRDQEFHRNRCCWGPKSLFNVKNLEEWKQDCEITTASMRRHIPDYPDPQERPRIVHKCLADFYKAIGFDPKTRCYRDKEGQEIKFSVLKDPAPAENPTGPEVA